MSASLLSIEKLSQTRELPFPAYFVASTAPINIEDQLVYTSSADPRKAIDEISRYLEEHKENAEVLVVIHGYNTSKMGVRDWFESIYEHLAGHYKTCSKGLLLIGYRWPSEQIFPHESEMQEEGGSFKEKRQSARQALPVILGRIIRLGLIGLTGSTIGSLISVGAIALKIPNAVTLLVTFLVLIMISLAAISPIVTILALRVAGYFRDSYRATNFGVSDLVELIRQIDSALVKPDSSEDRSSKEEWKHNRIKLSFIGHSMGGFVVTNTVRILSDVFDPRSIGAIDAAGADKDPPSSIGNVFCLGRLVLVSPDIPAETIISGRANFLQSSLRRFEEAYLFSNEGDMALRLASTAANYFSYPAKTQDGGYRLGNVTVRNSVERQGTSHTKRKALREGATMRSESYGMIARLPDGQLVSLEEKQQIPTPDFPLDYLFIREQKPLSERQKQIALVKDQKPIGEVFTFFDCTDYVEKYLDKNGAEKSVGVVSHALRKQALTFWNYVSLTIDYFSNKIDTHGGYFSNGEPDPDKGLKPEAAFTKLAIYGLACLGFERFLLELSAEPLFAEYEAFFNEMLADLESQRPDLTALQCKKVALTQTLSSICRDRGIQVLLAQERYTQNILSNEEAS